jgi:hypothetical protein
MALEELTGPDLEEFLAGYRAAQKGEPLWEHNTQHWLSGYRFYVTERRQQEGRRAWAN